MIVISLTYKVPIEEVEKHLAGHMDFLKKGYADGVFVASGRKVPRSGGVIIARGSIDAVRAFCETDPFVEHGLADLDLTEVAFSMVAEGFEAFKE